MSFSDLTVNEIVFTSFCLGFIFSILFDIVLSISNYINNKAWLVNDYEKIFYKIENFELLSKEEESLCDNASHNYKVFLDFKKKRKDFFNKIKSFFKR